MKNHRWMAPVLFGLSMLFLKYPVSATTIYVEKDGSGDYTVIQDAVDAAASGDTIRIGEGRYQEYRLVSIGGSPTEVYVQISQESLTILGESSENTVIGPTDPYFYTTRSRRGIVAGRAYGNLRAVIEGVRLVNLRFGVGSSSAADLTVRDCCIDSCYGGVYSYSADTLVVQSSRFTGIAEDGLCIFASAVPTIRLEDCDFFANRSGFGHQVLVQCQTSSDTRIQYCRFGGDTQQLVFATVIGDVNHCRFEGPASRSVVLAGAIAQLDDCIFDGSTEGILAYGSGTRLTMTGSSFRNMQDCSLQVSWIDSLRVNDCVLDKGERFAVREDLFKSGVAKEAALEFDLDRWDLTNNDWGTASADSIEAWISVCDPQRVVVDYFPFIGQPEPTSVVRGQALLVGESDHSGVVVSAGLNSRSVTGASAVTGIDGSFALTDLSAGTYTVRARKEGWSTQVREVTVDAGEELSGVDFAMCPTVETALFFEPNLALVDGGVVRDRQTVEANGSVSDVMVFVDAWSTNYADLVVTLVSPSGREVVLHNQGEGSLFGWYPNEITPYGDLDDLVGDELGGVWSLVVSDQTADGDTGMLVEWGMFVTYDAVPVSVESLPILVSPGDGRMGLSWRIDPAGVEGCNVYRRTADADYRRLNGQLLSVGDGHLSYMDDGAGLADGEIVFYSYTVVRDGIESGFAAATEAMYATGLPRAFALHGNTPNPFNPSTSIRFDLPKASRVRLDVFDVSGRLVRTLVDDTRPAGSYSVAWDGTDAADRRVASGVYYCRVETESHVATAKMLLAK